ncbi:MAG: hypothetical protein ACJ797_20050 [Ktedonobacteraceae bacterium]
MFHIDYIVRNRRNRRSEEDVFPETLADAIDSYCPDASLVIQIDESKIEVDVCRDMYGLHEDLLRVLECIAFDLPSEGPYREVLEPIQPGESLYTLIFTEFYFPRVIYFLCKGKYVDLQTRTLYKDVIIASSEDVTTPTTSTRNDIIVDSCSFLMKYLQDLAEEIPIVKDLDDYKAYLARLEKIQMQLPVWNGNDMD